MKAIAVVVLLVSVGTAQAQVMSFLVKQWFVNGSQMCEYDNGTVLNMGSRICPLSIKAGV
jgi:hypothetical protein